MRVSSPSFYIEATVTDIALSASKNGCSHFNYKVAISTNRSITSHNGGHQETEKEIMQWYIALTISYIYARGVVDW